MLHPPSMSSISSFPPLHAKSILPVSDISFLVQNMAIPCTPATTIPVYLVLFLIPVPLGNKMNLVEISQLTNGTIKAATLKLPSCLEALIPCTFRLVCPPPLATPPASPTTFKLSSTISPPISTAPIPSHPPFTIVYGEMKTAYQPILLATCVGSMK